MLVLHKQSLINNLIHELKPGIRSFCCVYYIIVFLQSPKDSIMAENKIELKPIKAIDGNNFIVPNYQRGYKWREKDVEYLIDDIEGIAEEDNSDYCLQPIVVAPTESGYILVDGQQRLTTIWLIINWAKHNNHQIEWNFSIQYDTRDDSNTFLKDIDEKGISIDVGTCDTHYFLQALHVIDSKKDKLSSFIKHLNKNVKIIWYEVDPVLGPAHFERLNNAKISLTNAELVKAFLLTRVESDIRARMACEWDEMEYRLQDDSFFSFITTSNSYYNKEYNRIELLLDLYVGTTEKDKEKDEFHTFNQVAQKRVFPKEIWQEIQSIYNRLLCWNNDNFLYNLIGLLVEVKGDGELLKIWNETSGKSINTIKEIVRERVIKVIPSEDNISSMVYKDPRVKNILLLFNVLSLMSVINSPKPNEYKYQFNDKFHFDLYRKEKWDKEHVHATASQSLTSKVEWVQWLKDLDYKLVEEKISTNTHKQLYLEWMKKARDVKDSDFKNIKDDNNVVFKPLTKELFTVMFEEIVKALEGENDDTDLKQNSIGNLVLLNANINRSGPYKVAPFSTKRRIIMERVKNGSFVPLCTQNVFMKVYTPHPGHFYKWEKNDPYEGNEKSDRDSYIEAIIDTLNRIK